MIAASEDDAEERGSSFRLHSDDLDFEPKTTVGLRYLACLPGDALITHATLTFIGANSNRGGEARVLIGAELASFPASFAEDQSLSDRARTNATVEWQAPPVGEFDSTESPDISPVLRELADTFGGDGCGYIVLLIETVKGDQNLASFDTGPNFAPVLDITFSAAV